MIKDIGEMQANVFKQAVTDMRNKLLQPQLSNIPQWQVEDSLWYDVGRLVWNNVSLEIWKKIYD